MKFKSIRNHSFAGFYEAVFLLIKQTFFTFSIIPKLGLENIFAFFILPTNISLKVLLPWYVCKYNFIYDERCKKRVYRKLQSRVVLFMNAQRKNFKHLKEVNRVHRDELKKVINSKQSREKHKHFSYQHDMLCMVVCSTSPIIFLYSNYCHPLFTQFFASSLKPINSAYLFSTMRYA